MLKLVTFLLLTLSNASEGDEVGPPPVDPDLLEAHKYEMEFTVIETLAFLRGQFSASTMFLQDIKRTLNGLTERMDKVDDKLAELETKNEELGGDLKRKISEIDNGISEMEGNLQGALSEMDTNIGRKVSHVENLADFIKIRQEAQINEVRLISLYKMTSSSSVHSNGFGHVSHFAVDGQFQDSRWAPTTPLRTFFHTDNNPPESIKIDLGALFRIHRVSVHNARHYPSCMERFIGTKILADDRLLGVAIRKKFVYDFDVPAGDAVYARSITLRQELAQYLNILEVQVWGTGPFNDSDKFA